MITDELLQWVRVQSKKIDAKFADEIKTEKEIEFAQVIKLMEEVGELSNEVLGRYNLQRNRGVECDKDALTHEVADVLITTLVVASRFDVDVNNALAEKIKKIDERFSA